MPAVKKKNAPKGVPVDDSAAARSPRRRRATSKPATMVVKPLG